ncbi:hypothetical protein CG740_23370 [Streptomyces sp. CB01201]|uniref:hypothetical protein n=1 Tax=Streptomyces sp. CB01201 TaxID=2020324 RepID=UPI000C27D3AC|nr:hypothetical protein [Streptomyces sp. CB01201]PJN00846.1 hypothetical protein CG740_23370 [Streptomyces sp. CB01201]
MTTDLTAADTNAAEIAMTEAYRVAVQEITRLRSELDEVKRDRRHLGQLLDEFAAAVAPADLLGEHTPDNQPWRNAIALITPMAVVDDLLQENARLRQENDDLSVGLGIPREPVTS